jgi:glycosyltransferase involved in cell wall biosynthesis
MIYIDVTSTCKSASNTGIQRIVRGIYKHLSPFNNITPVIWMPSIQSYARLTKTQYSYLTEPFSKKENLLLKQKIIKDICWFLQEKFFKINMSLLWNKGDVLIIPEIFQDNRTEFLPKLFSSTGLKTIAIFHDAISWKYPEWSSQEQQLSFPKYMKALASFQQIIAISNESAEDLNRFWEEHGILPAKITIEGHPIEKFLSSKTSLSKTPSVLCVSTLEPRKNHLRFLEACERLWLRGEVFEVVLIGKHSPTKDYPIIDKINALKEKNFSIQWRGAVDDAQLQKYYQECWFTIYPSLAEGFGLPIIESLFFGKPCICHSTGAIAEIAKGGGCLMIDTFDATEIEISIKNLFRNGSLRKKLIQEAAQRKFRTWEDYAASFAKFIT